MAVYSKEGFGGLNFDGLMLGIVVDNVDETLEGRIKVNIPKVFLGDETNDEGIWIRPLNFMDKEDLESKENAGSYRIPAIDSKVLVFFLDEDPQKGYYFPFSPSNIGEKINAFNTTENYPDEELRPNIDVIRSYLNGNRLEFDNNDNDYARFGLYYFEHELQLFKKESEGQLKSRWLDIRSEEELFKILSKSKNIQIGRAEDKFEGLNITEDKLRLERGESALHMDDDTTRLTAFDQNIRLQGEGITIVTDGGTRIDVGSGGRVYIKSSGGASIVVDGNNVTINGGLSVSGNISNSNLSTDINGIKSRVSSLEGRVSSLESRI